MKTIAGMGVLGLVIAYCLATLFWTKPDGVTVINHAWYGDRIIEDYQTRDESGWKSHLPDDAFDTSCWLRSKNKGVAYYCSYHVNRWQYVMTLRNEGDQLSTPSIPEPSLPCNGIEEIGCQRYAGEQVIYQVTFAHGLETVVCNYDKTTWDRLKDGQSYMMIFGAMRNEPRCALVFP